MKIKTKGLKMQFFWSDHNIDKQTGWVIQMHKPPHTRCKISVLAYTYITMADSLIRVSLIKTIWDFLNSS